ncbi:MAG: glycosyltransferase family 2 protein [Methylococcales bacterium]|nr:glycosyltransferase family 2 protein [Methylococcales bacterium]
MITSLLLLAAILALLLTLPGSLELLALTLAALAPKKTAFNATQTSPALPRLAVVMPAHNEAEGIAACVANLLASLAHSHGCTLVVIADNCQDATAAIAAQAGARVLERHNDIQRGKGYALDYAFKTLLTEEFDGFIVVDADSRVDVALVHEFQLAFAQGLSAAQCRYRIANPEASRRARLQYIAWLAFNELRLLGREQLQVSVGILGNGFALSRAVLEAVPYEAGSIAEDMEYHLRLVNAGYKVNFIDSVVVSSDAPNQGDNAAVQRTRWEGGRFRLIIDHVPSLFMGVLQGKSRLVEPLAELLLLPLAYHVLLLMATLLIPLPWLQYYALAGLALVAAHVLIAIRIGGGGVEDFKTLATVPFYILWKLTLMPKLWRNARNDAQWQRTDRENP